MPATLPLRKAPRKNVFHVLSALLILLCVIKSPFPSHFNFSFFNSLSPLFLLHYTQSGTRAMGTWLFPPHSPIRNDNENIVLKLNFPSGVRSTLLQSWAVCVKGEKGRRRGGMMASEPTAAALSLFLSLSFRGTRLSKEKDEGGRSRERRRRRSENMVLKSKESGAKSGGGGNTLRRGSSKKKRW